MSRKIFVNFLIIFYLKSFYCHDRLSVIRGFGQNFCRTPLDDIGSCVSLKFCPEILTLFTKLPQNSAKQYSMNLQRICGNRITVDNYPVVCCTTVSNRDISISNTTINSSGTTTTTTSTQAPMVTVTSNKNLSPPNSNCLTKTLQAGTCQPLQNCSVLFEELQKDLNNEQLKADIRTAHAACGSKGTVVCCPPTQNFESKTKQFEATKNSTDISIHQLPSEDEGCGLVNITLTKIVGGEESEIGAWPWMALIGYDPYSVKPFRCGGSLISARHVMTAAHCIRHDLSFVRLGEYDLSIESETRHVDINVIKHVKHPEYGKNRRSDMALLLLERSVQFSETIAPICMPSSIQLRSKSYIGTLPYVAGWGYTMQGGSSSNILRQAQMPIQENDVCRRTYRQLLPSLPPEDFDESIFCVGYTVGGVDTCQGDSGGPLMIPEFYKGISRYYLIGVVSYGHGCGKVPGIYINVQKKMDWILQQIQDM